MLNILVITICFAVLLWSSDLFVKQSLALAKKLKISGFLIGFTLVSIGTALPDITISLYSTIVDKTDIAISTFMGSALVNVTLLLGVLAFFSKYKLLKVDIQKNIPVTLAGITVLTLLILTFKYQLHWWGGILLLATFVIGIIIVNKHNEQVLPETKTKFNIFILLISLILVMTMGKLLIDNLTKLATTYNIETSILGFFLIGIVITIPELTTSIIAIKRGGLELSLGNILGSSLVNILLVPGIASLIRPINFTNFIGELIFLFIAILFFQIFALLGKKYYISKQEGIVLLLLYVIFILLKGIGI